MTERHETPGYNRIQNLVHLADESVDVLLTVAKITTLNEVLELAGAETTSGVAELEGPQEVGGLLEVGADGVDLVDEILHADNAVLAEVLLDDGVVGKGNTLLVDLAVSALVDELLDALEVGVTVGNPRLDDLDHLGGGLGDTDEDTVVDLDETEELQNLAGLGRDLVDTLDTDQEDQLGLSRDIEGAILLGNTSKTDLLTLGITVLLDVLLGTLEDDTALLLVGLNWERVSHMSKYEVEQVNKSQVRCSIRPERWLILQQHRRCLVGKIMICITSKAGDVINLLTNLLLLLDLSLLLSASLLLALALLEEGLGDEDLVLGGDGTVISQISP